MALRPFFDNAGNRQEAVAPSAAPLGGTRTEAIQRLQIGLLGLGAMLLLIGLANIITQRAQQTKDEAVPEATAPAITADAQPAQSDPLADAGVVPELPADPQAQEQAPPADQPPALRTAPDETPQP